MFDVITIGAAIRDVFMISDQFLTIKSKKIPAGIGEYIALGRKIDVDKLLFTTGGGATNAAATFASLGFHTATMTRIGNDASGMDVIEDLSRFGVSTHFVRMIKGGQTGYSVLLTTTNGERTALTYRGVSSHFEQKDIHWIRCKQTKWIYLSSLGGNIALSKKIILEATKNHVQIAWNPGHGELSAGMKEFSPLLPFVDIFIVNREEAILLTKKRQTKDIFKCIQTPGKIRLMTDGTNGTDLCKQDEWMAHAEPTGVKAISRTGAGDAFGSGFVAGFIRSSGNLKYALTVGTLNAESVVQQYGAKNGILKSWPGVIKRYKVKITSTLT